MARILIAEDDMAMRVFLDRALSRSGHEVNAVPNGDSAARCAESEVFDLMVIDVDMPGLNGVNLARQILARAPCQSILFVTGFAAQALEATDMIASGARILSKPFALSELVTQVDEVLAGQTAVTSGAEIVRPDRPGRNAI